MSLFHYAPTMRVQMFRRIQRGRLFYSEYSDLMKKINFINVSYVVLIRGICCDRIDTFNGSIIYKAFRMLCQQAVFFNLFIQRFKVLYITLDLPRVVFKLINTLHIHIYNFRAHRFDSI